MRRRVATEFLDKFRPTGPYVLTAIVPDGAIETITIGTTDKADEFVREHNGKRNLYYSVNPTKGAVGKKATKADIFAVEYLHADLDPRDDEKPEAAKTRYLKCLGEYELQPTIVVDSGNGINALWRRGMGDQCGSGV